MNHNVVSSQFRNRKPAAHLLMALSMSTLAGCGFLGERAPSPDVQQVDHEAIISSNLLNAVLQQSEMPVTSNTVQVTAPDSDFEDQVYKQMTHEGYVLETVTEEPAADTVEARVETQDDPASDLAPLYVVSVGGVSAERRYTEQDGEVFPASEMIIRGVDNGVAALNDEEVFGVVDDSLTTVVFETRDPVAIETGDPISVESDVPVKSDDPITIEDVLRPASAESVAGVSAQEKLEQAVRKNIFETQQSNFGDVFVGYEDVERITLIFPDDSMRLGDENKEIIQKYRSMMDPQTDVLSVIGCSLGPTEIDNGNAVLALGRASRVKEALVFSGVQPEKVLDEGCWAPQGSADNFLPVPQRGVVLTLKRAKPS